MKLVTLVGALLLAAPLFAQGPAALSESKLDPRVEAGQTEWFALHESPAEVEAALGRPAMVVPFGDFISWQYQIDVADHHDYSHLLVFRKDGGELISITRNWDEPRNVDAWFPADQTKTYETKDGQKFCVRARVLSGDRVLLAMGVSEPGEPTTQVMLIRREELRYFHSWLWEQMKEQERLRF